MLIWTADYNPNSGLEYINVEDFFRTPLERERRVEREWVTVTAASSLSLPPSVMRSACTTREIGRKLAQFAFADASTSQTTEVRDGKTTTQMEFQHRGSLLEIPSRDSKYV